MLCHFSLCDAEGHHRNLFRRESSLPQRLEERNVAVAVDGIQNHRRPCLRNLVGHPFYLPSAQQDVVLSDNLTSQCSELVFDDGVGSTREDVIGPNQEETLSQVVETPFHRRDDLLVGSRARIDNVRGELPVLRTAPDRKGAGCAFPPPSGGVFDSPKSSTRTARPLCLE